MLTTEILGFAYSEVGDPPLSMVSVQYSCWGPYLFDQSSQKEQISPGPPSFTSQTSKIWNACTNLFFILAVVLIRNLIPHRRHTMSP